MAEEESSSSSQPAPSSSKNRVKFLCSHGGKILPRPFDGQLKYVGGDTRVVSAPRPLSFSELKEKIGAVFPGEVVVRYQLLGEDLDALVTVKSDEDVHHMLDEYDRQELARSNSSSPTFAGGSTSTASPRFRLFLFPVDPAQGDSPPHRQSLLRCGSVEQRYIDAINGGGGVLRRTSGAGGGGGGGGGAGGIFTISSGGSSPTSTTPTAYPAAPMPVPSLDFVSGLRRMKPMNKAHSSPNLMQMGAEPQSGHPHYPYPPQPHHYHYQPQQTLYKHPTPNRSSHHLSSYHSNYPHPHHTHLHPSQTHNLPHPPLHQSHHGGGRTNAMPPLASEPPWRMNSGPSVNSGGGPSPTAAARPGSPTLSPRSSHLTWRQHYGAGPLLHTGPGLGLGPGPLRSGVVHVDDAGHYSRPRSLEGYYTWEQ